LETLKFAIKCVLNGLAALHALGIIHNDVRWPNIMLHPVTGNWCLIDFERASSPGAILPDSHKGRHLRFASAKSDLFSFGKTLTEEDDPVLKRVTPIPACDEATRKRARTDLDEIKAFGRRLQEDPNLDSAAAALAAFTQE
jgi:serine/threonine protein kinase